VVDSAASKAGSHPKQRRRGSGGGSRARKPPSEQQGDASAQQQALLDAAGPERPDAPELLAAQPLAALDDEYDE